MPIFIGFALANSYGLGRSAESVRWRRRSFDHLAAAVEDLRRG
jgi:hypothetical protein